MTDDEFITFTETHGFPLFAVVDSIDMKLYDGELFTRYDEADKFRIELEKQMPSLVGNDYLVVEINGKNDVRIDKRPFKWLKNDRFYFVGSSKYVYTQKQQGQ